MLKSSYFLSLSILFSHTVRADPPPATSHERNMSFIVENNLSFAKDQYLNLIEKIGPNSNLIPHSIGPDGQPLLVEPHSWVSGFFPGGLWYIYENTRDKAILQHAQNFTAQLEEVKYIKNDHDVGFIMYCSYGNGLRLTGREDYLNTLITTADSLTTRYSPKVRSIRSWDWGPWKFPVIIDNMMNLELLFFAGKQTNQAFYTDIAINHADTTLSNHFRNDGSSYHLINYDDSTGKVLNKETYQGFRNDSAWSRGQSWGLYGFTMAYRETGEQRYLDRAINIANFILGHKNMPTDMVPYWDFDADNIPNALKDSSAGAIIISALYELSNFIQEPDRSRFISAADRGLITLSSKDYRANFIGDNGGFLLKHGVGFFAAGRDINVPLSYGDYYFLEANIRKLRQLNGQNVPVKP